jgi:hypothetical protein
MAIESLIEEFKVQGNALFKNGTDTINCMVTKCIYAPIKNTICYDFLTGVALWIVSSLILLSGLSVLEVSWCIRRRTLAPGSQVDDSDDDGSEEEASEDGEQPLSNFGPAKG